MRLWSILDIAENTCNTWRSSIWLDVDSIAPTRSVSLAYNHHSEICCSQNVLLVPSLPLLFCLAHIWILGKTNGSANRQSRSWLDATRGNVCRTSLDQSVAPRLMASQYISCWSAKKWLHYVILWFASSSLTHRSSRGTEIVDEWRSKSTSYQGFKFSTRNIKIGVQRGQKWGQAAKSWCW